MKKDISFIVFWGAVWGLFEATVGYVPHLLTFGMGWLIWFPAAFYFMDKACRQTGRRSAALYTAFIAAAIKLVDFLLPVRMDMVLNPTVSILLEGSVVFAAFKILGRKGESKFPYWMVLTVSAAWRLLYILYLPILPAYLVKISPLSGMVPFLKFIVMQSLANSIVIFLVMKMAQKITGKITGKVGEGKWKIFFRPVFSFSLLALAILVQRMI